MVLFYTMGYKHPFNHKIRIAWVSWVSLALVLLGGRTVLAADPALDLQATSAITVSFLPGYETGPLYDTAITALDPLTQVVTDFSNVVASGLYTTYDPEQFANTLVDRVIVLWTYFSLFDNVANGLTPLKHVVGAYMMIFVVRLFVSVVNYALAIIRG